MAGATFAVQPREFGETFFAFERSEAEDDPPKMGKMRISNHCSDSLEKSLAKRGKSV